MPIQNKHEIHELVEVALKLEGEAHKAKNNANPEAIERIQKQLCDVQEHIQQAHGKAINGNDGTDEPLFQAHQRLEESQRQMERALTNLNAQQDNVQP